MNIYVDHRERNIVDTINDEFSKPLTFGKAEISVIHKTLEIGDYMITMDVQEGIEKVLCIIERKTIRDYGDSLVDGRSTNLDKLLALKKETNCKIQYIVEGNHNPAMSEKFGGIEYSSILANIMDISIVHDIQIARTKDKRRTAEYLKFLCERYYHVYPTIQGTITGSGEINDIVKKCKPTADEEKTQQLLIIWHNLLSKSDKINTKPISTARALVLAQKWSLKDWLEGTINEQDVLGIKINGKRLDSHQIDRLSKPMPRPGQIKLLSCIKGITEVTAKALIGQKPLLEIIQDDESKNLVISDKGLKLGKAKHKKMVDLCLMKV